MQIQAIEATGLRERLAPASTRCPACGQTNAQPLLSAPDRFHGRRHFYKLLRCPACSLVWLMDPPPPAEMGQHYGPDYDKAIAGVGDDPEHWRERREVLLQYKTGGSLLDLGCSAGGFLRSVRSSPWDLYGIEMSDEVAKKAAISTGATVFVGNILDAPFESSSFDAITCFHVFEHLYEPREVLAKVSQWLKPSGIFYAMMPNIDSAGAHIFRSFWYALELPRHLYHFSPMSLRRMARSVGLEEVSITTHREVFVEQSARYLVDEVFRKYGIARRPLAKAELPSIPFRVMRKLFRLTVLPVLSGMASVAGDGESIHAIFTKQ